MGSGGLASSQQIWGTDQAKDLCPARAACINAVRQTAHRVTNLGGQTHLEGQLRPATGSCP